MKLDSISHWCLYRERSVFETRNYLKAKGCLKPQIEALLSTLSKENLINDCRFAQAYVSGKIRINKWGKQKIRAGLYKHQISEECITLALNQCDENTYVNMLKAHINMRKNRLSEEQLIRWLLGKGFEYQLIVSLISKNFKHE